MKYCDWSKPPGNLTLLENEIHLWRANLDLPSVTINKLASSLSEDERTRANCFRFEQHRQHFIAGRGILRQLVANYLQVKSDLVIFEYSSRGKPHLASALNQGNLHFNVSHSQGWALYGFNYQRIIGVDLEFIKDNIDYKQLAKRFFTSQEVELINSYPAREQKTIFFQLWTAKEAYLKAKGDGLAGSLDSIQFTLNHNQEINLVAIKQDHKQASNWLIKNFIPQDNFVATIVVENSSPASNSIATKFFEYQFLVVM